LGDSTHVGEHKRAILRIAGMTLLVLTDQREYDIMTANQHRRIAKSWRGNLGVSSSCPGDGKGIVRQRRSLGRQRRRFVLLDRSIAVS